MPRGYPGVYSICSVGGCGGTVKGQGYCGLHYKRLRRLGTIELPRRATEMDRFWAKVEKSEGCWLWQGARNQAGYGHMHVIRTSGRRLVYAHRLSYELNVGPIPKGLHIDHLCRTLACVRPDHLEPVTHAENTRRGATLSAVTAREGVCQRGHAMTLENTYRRPDGSRVRCRRCHAIRASARRQKAVA